MDSIMVRKKVSLFLALLSLILALPCTFTEPAQAFQDFLEEEGVCRPDSEIEAECVDPEAEEEEAVTDPVKSEIAAPRRIEQTLPAQQEMRYKTVLYFFSGKGCPHCSEEKRFLAELTKKHQGLEVKEYEVWYSPENAALLQKLSQAYRLNASGVPVTFIGDDAFVGFSKHSAVEIEAAVTRCISEQCVDPLEFSREESAFQQSTGERVADDPPELECTEKSKSVYIPWIGSIDASQMSLPVMTLVIAGLDSFNPCAFFVLLSLLGLLIHAQSRRKMLLIGAVFVFFSGFIYFLFMAAWLNLFLVMGQVRIITYLAGAVAVVIAAINIKDFFWFKKGVSLTIPDTAKPKLFDRMRRLLRSTSVASILLGAAVLAAAANAYELLCTAGFPMVFTRILTLNALSASSYYFYLVIYNIIYIIPMGIIVVAFTVTLGKKHLSEWQGRVMKLVSGMMMLALGFVLLFNPEVLSNAGVSFLLLGGSMVFSLLIAFVTRKMSKK
jgi:glutaredoxin